MITKKHIAEFIGTFALSFVVLMAIAFQGVLPLGLPLIAGFTVMLFVYILGPISGCHINPSITIGLWSVKKISNMEAGMYIISQFLGALAAMLIAGIFLVASPIASTAFSLKIFLAEALGAFFFNFGIASVVYGKAKDQMSGFVIGGSLIFGILVASLSGSAGILNPAVALAINSFSLLYLLAPIVGAVAGFFAYRAVADGN